MKKERGITIVALVITIIVLIILAGISINTLIGENGIMTKAKQAKQNIILAGEAEALQLNQLYYELETGGELTEDEESAKKDEIIALLQKQVEELQNQVKTLTTENEDLKQQIADLTTQIGTLQTEIEALKEQISQKDIEIEDLKAQVSEKEAKIQELQNQLNNINSLLAQTNATSAQILSGYKAYSNGQLVTGTMNNWGYEPQGRTCALWTAPDGITRLYTYVPGSDEYAGGYIERSISIPLSNVANALSVTASKVAVGQSIAGITGTYTSDATATANNLSSGTTAYVNGQKITGNGTDVNNAYNNGYNAGYNQGKTDNKIIKLADFNGSSSALNFDCKNVSGWQSLTINNFIVGIVSASVTQTSNQEYNQSGKASGFSLKKEYNASTGILTLTGTSQQIYAWDMKNYARAEATQSFTGYIYIVY